MFKRPERFLIVGGDATIGQNLAFSLRSEGKDVWQTTRHLNRVGEQCLFLNLSETSNYESISNFEFDIVFLCAAITSIESCKAKPEAAWQVNVNNTIKLAEILSGRGAFIIFLSTSAVFNGEKPYAKALDPVDPRTEYGRQKAEAEERLLKFGHNAAIVRLSKVIIPNAPLLLNWVEDLKVGKEIHPFNNMTMAPISLKFAMAVLLEIAEKKKSGIIQISADRDISYEETALYLSKQLGASNKLIQSVSSSKAGIDFSPKYTTFDSESLEMLGLSQPSPICSLDYFLENYTAGAN